MTHHQMNKMHQWKTTQLFLMTNSTIKWNNK